MEVENYDPHNVDAKRTHTFNQGIQDAMHEAITQALWPALSNVHPSIEMKKQFKYLEYDLRFVQYTPYTPSPDTSANLEKAAIANNIELVKATLSELDMQKMELIDPTERQARAMAIMSMKRVTVKNKPLFKELFSNDQRTLQYIADCQARLDHIMMTPDTISPTEINGLKYVIYGNLINDIVGEVGVLPQTLDDLTTTIYASLNAFHCEMKFSMEEVIEFLLDKYEGREDKTNLENFAAMPSFAWIGNSAIRFTTIIPNLFDVEKDHSGKRNIRLKQKAKKYMIDGGLYKVRVCPFANALIPGEDITVINKLGHEFLRLYKESLALIANHGVAN